MTDYKKTDYKQLCAELVDDLELCDWPYKLKEAIRADIERARAALAEPEPDEPTDEELLKLTQDWPCTTGERHDLPGCPEVPLFSVFEDELCDFARAVLARWGRSAPQPIPLDERLPGAEDCDAEGRCWLFRLGQDSVGDWFQRAPYPSADAYRFFCVTHWLPAHALPIPRHD